MNKRLFAAIKIDLTDKTKEFLRAAEHRLAGENIKWVDYDNIHITLNFFGDTDQVSEEKIINVLSKTACRQPNFKISLQGLGCFRRADSTQILWIGINNSQELIDLNKVLMEELLLAGLKVSEHKFRPHITIARINSLRDGVGLRELLVASHNKPLQTVAVDKIILFQSILKPQKPVYLEEKSFFLPKI